jgi:lysine decarboxylase/arginine decarboxylase
LEKLIAAGGNSFVSAGLVTPYPPGIPLLVPNQKITEDHIKIIKGLLSENVEIHGCHNEEIVVINSNSL